VPGEEELAMRAIALGRVRVLNPSLVQSQSVSEAVIDAVTAREQRELTRREHLYRGDRPLPDVRCRTVILVDDGIATGATMRAAIAAVRQQAPARVVVAVPVAAAYTCDELRAEGNDVVCVRALEELFTIGLWYEDFPQTTDGEIQALLARAWQARPAAQHAEQDAHP
jgi:predicted phosphoribosyltransferase